MIDFTWLIVLVTDFVTEMIALLMGFLPVF